MSKETFSNPMKTATVVFTTTLDAAKVKEYFEGKKVTLSGNAKAWTATYQARGAAKNDIVKRLDAMTRQDGKFTVTSATVVNEEPKVKAPKAEKAKAKK